MYFILFDPIFWINHTLATLTSMVSKLQRQIEKVDAELEATKGVQGAIMDEVEEKTQKMADKTNGKLLKIKTKSAKKKMKVVDKADVQINSVRRREIALADAKRRAENTAKNINKLMED